MVDLTLDRPGDHLFIRSVGNDGIQVADVWYSCSLVIAPEALLEDWPPERLEDLTVDHLEVILNFRPEVVLIGTGERHRNLSPELMMAFYGNGVGVEAMTTAAACRTFNVLAGEGRRVVAALLPPGK